MFPGHWSGTIEARDRAEAPLLKIDEVLQKFVAERGLSVRSNSSGWPDRDIRWATNQINNLIQIYLISESDLTFSFWIASYQDRDLKRCGRKLFLFERDKIEDIQAALEGYLIDGHKLLMEWSLQPNALKFWVNLGNPIAP